MKMSSWLPRKVAYTETDFFSMTRFMNHEKSKKHLKQVALLREMMKEEDELFEESTNENELEDEAELSTNQRSPGNPIDLDLATLHLEESVTK